MTDEQLGRLWCERNGKRPESCVVLFRWWPDDDPLAGVSGLPQSLWPAVNGYDTEADAYAAVGAALRTVVRLADEVRQLEGKS